MSQYLEKVSDSLLRSASGSDFSRKLDNYDQNWEILHELGNLMICNAVSILTDSPLQLEDVVDAAKRVADRHAMLRAKIVTKRQSASRTAKFFEESSAPLDVEQATGDWQTVWKKEQKVSFDTKNGPLWRLRLIESNETVEKNGATVYRTWFVACFHHVVMDGMARQKFWEELCDCIRSSGSVSSQPSTSPSTPSSEGARENVSEKFLEPLEKNVAEPISSVVGKTILQRILDPVYAMGDKIILHFGILLTIFFRQLRVAKSNPFSRVYASEKFGDKEESYTGIVPIVFDEETTKKLAQLSKKWQTPMNALLTGIAASGVQEMVGEEEEIVGDLDLYTMQAISARRWFNGQSLPAIGCYTTLMGLNLKVPKDKAEFQNFVKSINGKVHDKVDRASPSAALGEWQVVTNFLTNASESGQVESLRDLVNPDVRPSVFLISNTGRWEQKNVDEVKYVEVETSWSCVNQHDAGNNLFSHNLVTMGGKLHWSLQYASRFTNQKCAQKYGMKIQSIVKSLAQNQRL